MLLSAAAFVLVLLSLCIRWLTRRPEGIPPGPPSLPIFGNLLSMAKGPHIAFKEWKEKYGAVFSVYFGNRLVVVLNSTDVIREVLQRQGDNFSARPEVFCMDMVTNFQKAGIGNNDGPGFVEHRKFTVQVLRDLGVGKPFLEEKIVEEVQILCESFLETNQQPFDAKQLINYAVSNIICQMAFNTRYQYDDAHFLAVMKCYEDNFELMGNAAILNWIPWLRFLPFGGRRSFKAMGNNNEYVFEKFLQPQLRSHKVSFDPDNVRDFTDNYLKEMHARQGTGTFMNELQLEKTVNDLMAGGSETTTTTLRWALLFLLHHPDVQRRVQREIDGVVGRARMPRISDREQLPYTGATIFEIQRAGNMAPFGLLHANFEDALVNGYKIPAGTAVMANLYGMHADADNWPQPDKFIPERFLDGDGKLLTKVDNFMPFSTGRRFCVGELLAKMELFLFFTGLLHRFTFKPATVDSLPSTEGHVGLSVTPQQFKVIAVPR